MLKLNFAFFLWHWKVIIKQIQVDAMGKNIEGVKILKS